MTRNSCDTSPASIADLHYGSEEFDEKRFLDFIERVKDEKAYIILAGDMLDNATLSSPASTYQQHVRPLAQKDWLTKVLEDCKDRVLAAVGGNHERRSLRQTDDSPLYDVMCRLGIETRYRESMAFLFLNIGGRTKENGALKKGKDRPAYGIVITHGAGGGTLVGTGASRAERFGNIVDGMDLLVYGHTHRPLTFPSAKLVMDKRNGLVQIAQFKTVCCTSWLKYGGYPLEKMLAPTPHEQSKIVLSARGKNVSVIT